MKPEQLAVVRQMAELNPEHPHGRALSAVLARLEALEQREEAAFRAGFQAGMYRGSGLSTFPGPDEAWAEHKKEADNAAN